MFLSNYGDGCKIWKKYGPMFATHSFTNSNTIGYEKAPFYFWFNTAFVQDKLILHREDLDNPHKPKTWQHFHENFTLEVGFQTFC